MAILGHQFWILLGDVSFDIIWYTILQIWYTILQIIYIYILILAEYDFK